MRRIISAISVLALAFSLVASATSANAAVAGYDSAYAGESAFLSLSPGQSGSFTVFFGNTGSTSWVKGTASQVDLAACLDDKTTCNAQDATEAPFNSGWLSATRYATHSQTTVAPGGIGTFTYNVAVPTGTAAGTYRFNGALVLSATGADIRNEGYYQDVTVAAATAGTAATLTSISPTSGTSAGGQTVTLTGTGFVCTPTFPTVSFGTTAATITSCGSTTITATTPAGAVGATTVTVTNTGAAASNGVTYTYTDTTRPAYTAVSVTGGASNGTATLTFSEAICEIAATPLVVATDFTVTVNGIDKTESGETLVACNSTTAPTNGVTSFALTFAGPIVNGDVVAVTLNASGAAKIRDAASGTGNTPLAQTQSATASADSTAPSISSGTASATNTLTLTYNERVTCNNTIDGQFSATPTGGSATAATAVACTAGPTGATTITVTFPASTFASGVAGTVTYTQSSGTAANRIKDINGNDATSPQTVTYTAFSADASAPTMIDTRLTTNGGFTTQLDANDQFKVVFSEAMDTTSLGDILRVTDADGTVVDFTCNNTVATCSWNTAAETVGGVSQAAATVLTVQILTTPPTTVGGQTIAIGTVAGLQIPATITDTNGITDAAGNATNIAGSADRIIDAE